MILRNITLAALTVFFIGSAISCKKDEPEEPMQEPSSVHWVTKGEGRLSTQSAFEDYRRIKLTQDQAGNVFVAGGFEDVLTLDPDNSPFYLESLETTGGFVFKYSSEGERLFAKRVIEGGEVSVHDFIITSDGGMAISGNIDGSGFFKKLNANGDLDWELATSSRNVGAIGEDAAGNLLVFSNDYLANDPFQYLTKYTEGGVLIWQVEMHVPNNTVQAGEIDINSSGEVLLASSFRDSISFTSASGVVTQMKLGIPQFYHESTAFSKWSSDGELLTNGYFGEDEHTIGTEAVLFDDGRMAIGGEFTGNPDMDPDPDQISQLRQSTSYYSYYVTFLDSEGGLIWTRDFQGTSISLNEMKPDADGNLWVCGRSSSVINTGFGTPAGRTDITDNEYNDNGYGYLLRFDLATGNPKGYMQDFGPATDVLCFNIDQNNMIVYGGLGYGTVNLSFNEAPFYQSFPTENIITGFYFLKDELPN